MVVLKRLAAAALGVPRRRWPLIMAPLAVIGSVLLGHPLLTLAAVLWLAPRLPLLLFLLLYPETLKSQDSAPSEVSSWPWTPPASRASERPGMRSLGRLADRQRVDVGWRCSSMARFAAIDRALSKISDLRTLFYYQRYFEWGLPTRRFAQVNIETISTCTRRCHFCAFGIKEKAPVTRMPADLFFRIVDDLAAMNFDGRFSLFSINEPLMDKRIDAFTRYASLMLPGCYHLMVTNGDLLSIERLDTLMDCGLDHLMINSYDRKALEDRAGIVAYAAATHPGKVTHVDRTTYTDWVSRAGHIKQYAKPPVSGYCDWPNYALYVKPDGKVLACCHDLDGTNTVGDLATQSTREVWYGEAFARLRARLNRGDRSVSALCRQCDHTPDLNYFRDQHLMSYRKGKTGLLLQPKVSATAFEAARRIKVDCLSGRNSIDTSQ